MAASIAQHGTRIIWRKLESLSIFQHHFFNRSSINYSPKRRQQKNVTYRRSVDEFPSPPLYDGFVDRGRGQRDDVKHQDSFVIPDHIKYHLLGESDTRFGPVVALTKNRRLREEKKIFLLEGSRDIFEAINAGIDVKSIFFTKGEMLEHFPLDDLMTKSTELYKVRMGHMQLWSTMVAASGIMAVCKQPKAGEPVSPIKDPLPLTLVCENYPDHGNIGVLLRSAAAAGCQQVLFAPGSGDPWDAKSIRAGCGAQYSLQMLTGVKWPLIRNYFPPESNVYITDGRVEEDDERLSQSMQGEIISYQHSSERDTEEFDEEQGLKNDSSFKDEKLISAFRQLSLQSTLYSVPDYTKSHTVLIVSGNVSGEAKKLVFDHQGEKLYAPMSATMTGINASVNASLVMFEMNRQYSETSMNKGVEGSEPHKQNIMIHKK